MMDGSMFPDGWHPTMDQWKRDFQGDARYLTRLRRPPKYYLIDFGLSRRYNPANGPPLEPPINGGDKTVPEFQGSISPCNPFPTDIYYAGNFIRVAVMKEYKGLGFMGSLVSDMVQNDPAKRPTIDEVVTRFDVIRKQLGTMKLRSRVGPRDESFGAIRDLAQLFRIVKHALQGLPAIPTR